MRAAKGRKCWWSLPAALLLIAGSACSSGDPEGPSASGSISPTALPSASGTGVVSNPGPSPSLMGFEVCEPDELEMPEWVPDELPLPEGTFATATQETISGYERGFFVVPAPTTIQDITRLIVEEWPKVGYELGRGDSEAGEVESEFSRPPAVGAFKIQATTCGYLAMLLIYAPDGPKIASPSPSG